MYYDDIASGYNKLHQEEQEKKIKIITHLLSNNIISGDILDVGTGTGFSLDQLHKATKRKCLGIEPSKGMIATYKGKQELIQGNAESIPFSNETFAIVVSITAIQNFTDILKGIEEIKRVTKKKGKIIITCLKKSPKIKYVTETISELLIIEEIIEEEKDLIFNCRKKK